MSRNVCIFQDFITPDLEAQIRTTAEEVGMTAHFFTSAQSEEASACLQDCEVLYAQSPAMLRKAPATLKWYCASSAGVDVYCGDPSIFANPDCLLTNSNSYGVTIAEHTIMVTLMMMRRMPEFQEGIRNRVWMRSMPQRSIRDCEVVIVGAGDIGINVAERMRGMGAAKVIGLSRSGKARSDVFDEVLPISQLDEILPSAHLLILALPGTPETYHILNQERIALLPSDALVVNVGRGTAIDLNALTDALNAEAIAGAALDVTEPEPLPQDHPLWDAKNLVLTPHIAGNLTIAYTRHHNVNSFCEDLRNYAAGKPLAHLVNRKLGY